MSDISKDRDAFIVMDKQSKHRYFLVLGNTPIRTAILARFVSVQRAWKRQIRVIRL